MGKSKAGRQNAVARQQMHGIRNGSVGKNKNPKFKNTPKGKVNLINNSKMQNKNAPLQKNIQKDLGAKNNQNSPKGKAQRSKQNFPKGKQNSPVGAQVANKKTNLNPKKKLEEVDSDSDIDEGILPQDSSLNKSDETFEDEEESDSDVPDILGKSLKDESDEDDEDFEEEEEDEDDDIDMGQGTVEHRGIKMFKGMKSKTNPIYGEDDSDESDEDIDFNQLCNMKNDEGDEDDESDEEDEDDDEDEEGDEDHGEQISSGKIKNLMKNDDDDEDDDDDDDDDDEDEDEDEDSAPGLKALLDSNIADDDDDEDFNEEDEDEDDVDEDTDISDEDETCEENNDAVKEKAKVTNSKDASKGNKQPKEGQKTLSFEEQEEIKKRTVIIDNILKETKEEDIKKLFGKFGTIDNIYINSLIGKNKKIATMKQMPVKMITTVTARICYNSQDSAQKALVMNGKQLAGNYMNVIIAAKSARKPRDNKKAVFLGNLKYGLENNILWKHFSKCGEIENVKILRDKTGITRGCGYINFKTKEAAMLALQLDGDKLMDRSIRVKPCITDEMKTNQKQGNKRVFSDKKDGNASKKFKNISEKPVARKPEKGMKQYKKQKNTASPEGKKLDSFQGQKVDIKKKKKGNRVDKKKKDMAKKLTAKPNKPVKV